jgi:mannose-6-phosphate isomerase-like protein (cupin superfamily)
MVPVREKESFDPQPWDGTETKLPGKCENGGYFLKDGAGEKFAAGGVVVRGMCTRKETAGRFSIYAVEASAAHLGRGLKSLSFKETHHAFQTIDGVLKLVIDGKDTLVTAGETVFIPAGTAFSVEAETSYVKAYVFANGGGIGEVISTIGTRHEGLLVPEEAVVVDESKLKSLDSELGIVA